MKAFLITSILAGVALPAAAADFSFVPPSNPMLASGLHPKAAVACAKLFEKTANGSVGDLPFERLDQLPKSTLTLAVLVSVDGCPVKMTRFGGVNYYVAPSIVQRMRIAPVKTSNPAVEEVAPLPLAPR